MDADDFAVDQIQAAAEVIVIHKPRNFNDLPLIQTRHYFIIPIGF